MKRALKSVLSTVLKRNGDPKVKSRIETTVLNGQGSKVIAVPVYDLPNGRCSQYARLAANDLFGERFLRADAWNRRYNDESVASVGGTTLRNLADSEVLQPGMMVGVHYPDSKWNGKQDQEGKPIEYSHAALYIGRNTDNDPLLAEHFIDTTQVRSETQYREAGLTPRVIFRPKV